MEEQLGSNLRKCEFGDLSYSLHESKIQIDQVLNVKVFQERSYDCLKEIFCSKSFPEYIQPRNKSHIIRLLKNLLSVTGLAQ